MHDTCSALQELSCSLKKTNPGVTLTILAVDGDLSSSTQLEVKKHGNLLLVDDIQFANFKLDGRSASTNAPVSAISVCYSIEEFVRTSRLLMAETLLSNIYGFGVLCT